MKVLSIGTDRGIFKKDSAVRARMVEYGELFDELHIVIFTKSKDGFLPEKISPKVWVYPTNSSSRWLYTFGAITLGKSILEKEIKKDQKNWAVSAQDPFETGFVGVRIAKRFNIPLQIQIHTDFLSPYFKRHSFINRARLLIARYTLPKANSIRVVSERICESIQKAGIRLQTTPQILPIFVDVEKIKNASITTDLKKKYPQFSSRILMASRLTPEKDLTTAILVMKEVIKTHPKAGMIIVGDGPEKLHLIRKVKKLGLDSNVIFESWQNDLASYYKTADIFLLTSLFEGYGMTLVEASAASCAIITSDVGIARNILNDNSAFICPVKDVKCFAESINALINDGNKRVQLGKNAQEKIAKSVVSKVDYLEKYKRAITDLNS